MRHRAFIIEKRLIAKLHRVERNSRTVEHVLI